MKSFPLAPFFAFIVGLHGIDACALESGKRQVCYQKHCFSVEIASTQETRKKGLMFREKPEINEGMLFEFEKDKKYPIWMKNMRIPLDILWLGEDRRVVHIEAEVPPCDPEGCPSITPSAQARYVLELPSGTVRRLGIVPGDPFEWTAP